MPDLTAPIAAVTVFTDLARVTRRGKLALEAGENQTVVVSGLTELMQEDSVRASGRGAGLKILGVEVKTGFAPEGINIAELQTQLEALHDTDSTLLLEDEALKSRLEFLKTLREQGAINFAKTLAYNESEPDSVTTFMLYIGQETSTINTRRHEITRQRRALGKEIEVQKARINQRQHDHSLAYKEVHVSVSVDASVEAEFDIDYVVYNASWRPLYDVRLVNSHVTLTYLAEISQNSREDWHDVKLSLSTARPAISATLPELLPWYIDTPRPPMAKSTAFPMQSRSAPAAAPQASMSLMADEGAILYDMQEPAPEAEIAQASVDNSGLSVTYHVDKPITVPSDGTPHKTTITTLALKVKLDYLTVPKLAEEAYLRATITNTSDVVLLPGSAAIFHDMDFVGRTFIETVAPDEEFKVQLGVDNRVRVHRELARREVAKNLIGNTRRTVFGYTITVTNLQPTAIKITVYDQLPVSKHENIKVKLQDVAPEAIELSDLNILEWQLDIAAGAKRAILFTFSVENPRDTQVAGLG